MGRSKLTVLLMLLILSNPLTADNPGEGGFDDQSEVFLCPGGRGELTSMVEVIGSEDDGFGGAKADDAEFFGPAIDGQE